MATVAILSLLHRTFMRICRRLFATLIGAEPPGARGTTPSPGVPARVSS